MKNLKILSKDVVLLDIGGTACPLSFVKNVMFQYTRANVARFLAENWTECQNEITALKEHTDMEILKGNDKLRQFSLHEPKDTAIAAISANASKWIDEDHKFNALKRVQGKMCRWAYENGDGVLTPVYDDTKKFLERMTSQNTEIYVYSSASVETQKLFFRHTTQGNLSKYISGYFDISVGCKTHKTSYEKIAASINQPLPNIWFLTDLEEEAHAALDAGAKSIVVSREDNDETTINENCNRGCIYIPTFDVL